ncbi:sn-glycerol-3-phosphate ABC transporter ATP-binding protein UgpC [Aquamicrobium sp. LC103]|uniref:ABC transporter ATP-binding protein n=1 Tax=Aquamicrobium sp. LC103 TaxID=1120658 RepID=UPI00063EB161|nr:sn-glycerol-3-phosphate ABC transporter ATP-binding protein UgpC [Aquamicrobium sp. LC103]TKT76277.1 sn-glycerol-3-phosphate ABC transporter ATP-binding protein UgpC [Aquamicrobium sp. LC103]
MAKVSINQIVKHYGDYKAVRGVDLDIADGEFLVLVGPSGCGKSTMLRMIAGLEDITDGEMRIGDKIVNDVAPRDRDIAMVFQSYALYPHMNVYENMGFGLKLRKTTEADIRQRVENAAEILGLSALLDRKPKELSGGQRQRVAMGRAIVRNPEVFLFDEPLSNLDAKLRVQMRTEIKKLHQKLGTTTIYVTHDQIEAMTLADRVVVMNQGVIEQVGPPQELYRRPATRFVASFIGSPSMNFIPCTLQSEADGLIVVLENGERLSVPADRRERYADHVARKLEFGIRPEHLTERRETTQGHFVPMTIDVDVAEPMGMETLVHFQIGNVTNSARIDPEVDPQAGQRLELMANMSHMHLIDTESGKVI